MSDYIGKPLSLKDLVAIDDGAVVSKTLLKKEAGNLTLFSFDAGQGLTEHTSPFDAAVYIVEGAAEIAMGGDTITAKEGELLIMPANVPHALHAARPFKMLLIMIRSKE